MCSAKSSKAELELQYKMAVVETLTADGQDAGMAKGELSKLIEIQSMVEQYRQVIVEVIYRDHDALH